MSAPALASARPSLIPGYTLPSLKFLRRLIVGAATVGALVITGALLGFKPWLLITDFHHILRLAGEMTPPNFALLFSKASLYKTVAETLAMAFLGTLAGGAFALLLAFFAAANTSPHPAIRSVVRTLFGLERATPNFIVLMVLLVAVGFGPFAGLLALGIGTVGMFGKLFADAIEQIDAGPAEAVTSVGATRWQVIRYAVFPQVLPSVVANWFYAFDVNLRAAIALGVYGGGGIGFELQLAIKVLRYRDVLALVILIIVLITVMERISDAVRRRLLGNDLLK
jgi:phosphonate transport system permease protein